MNKVSVVVSCVCEPQQLDGCPICQCEECGGSGLTTIYNYDGNGSDADDQPCPFCAMEREAREATKEAT